ncbi:MAG: DUF1643 domain-containing protein [Luminiphilus sp.]|nr:DUF1643 domain-containing protein [Luminiphilus sp.]
MTCHPSGSVGKAGFSRCGRYRYWLRRRWATSGGQCAFIGLNPSTATAHEDDPTLRRCVDFAQRWGYGSLLLVNLFALCATDPSVLTEVADPVGQRTNLWLQRAVSESAIVIAAWGNGGGLLGRAQQIQGTVKGAFCLGITQQGMPRHPLYCAKTTPLQRLP